MPTTGYVTTNSPILEMVTEKYLLREEEEWLARHRAMKILDDLLLAFKQADIKTIAELINAKNNNRCSSTGIF